MKQTKPSLVMYCFVNSIRKLLYHFSPPTLL